MTEESTERFPMGRSPVLQASHSGDSDRVGAAVSPAAHQSE